MRITDKERAAIKAAVLRRDSEAKVYLYGSRADDHLKGGDIDLFIISDKIDLGEKISLLTEIKTAIGEQRIDLLVKARAALTGDAFVLKILPQAIEL